MGKVKLEIKKLENASARQTTYSKRKNGILKKAHELSVLCDIDLLLIMFSPGGKPSFCFGKHSIEEVVKRFNQVPPQERTKRKLEGLEALKKTFKKLGHDVNIQDFTGASTPTIKDLTDEAAGIHTRLAHVNERLGYWTNPDRVSDVDILSQMESSLQKSLEQLNKQKENLQKRQRLSLESRTQIPLHLPDDQQLQPIMWAPNDNLQHLVLPQDTKLLAQREIESCTGSSSGSYFGCKSESNSPGQLSATDNIGQDLFQGLQFNGQYPYVSQGLNMQGDGNLQALLGLEQQQEGTQQACHVGSSYQPTSSWHDIINRLPPESPAESAFGDYMNYHQKLAPAPTPAPASAPAIPSIYETIASAPSNLLFENTITPNNYA